MVPSRFQRSVELPVSVDEAFAWHARPGALERLLPPWDDVKIVRRDGGIADGAQVELSLKLGPIRVRWLAEHRDVSPPRQFRDVSLRGPFPHWDHLHRFEPQDDGTCRLEDSIEYRPPGGTLGRILGGDHVETKLDRMFQYRHATTLDDLAMHAARADQPRMKVAISGASGLIGRTLSAVLTTGGHHVVALERGPENRIDVAPAAGADAVVHLAGENIAKGRWTERRKQAIYNSRVEVTRWLCEDLLRLSPPPRVLVSASAVGFYGGSKTEPVHEHSARGDGFLADVCLDWENASRKAEDGGLRVVNARFGAILSPAGGMLATMLPMFKLGMGGRVGSGEQQIAWATVDDAVGAIHHSLMEGDLHGPMNVVAPESVSNAQFARTLGRVLGRPAIAPVPATATRIALGELADELLLSGRRVEPRVLERTGYAFRHPRLEDALRHLLGRA